MPNGKNIYSPLGIFDFQADHIAEAYVRLESQSGVLAVWDTGLGKGLGVHEPVLTPRGWVPIGEIQTGDHVTGSNGLPTRVTGVYPQGVRPLYRVTFSDGSSVVCDENHLWTVRYWGSDRSSGRQTRVQRESVYSVADLLEKGVKTPKGRRKFAIPMTKPVQYAPTDLPVPAYQLGAILGDGHIRDSGEVSLSTDKEIIESFGIFGEPRYRSGCFYKTTSKYATQLKEMGLAGKRSNEKFVPRRYLHAPEEDRRDLLAGLLDTDGSPMEDGGVEFCSTSEALADAVIELTESLGGIARNKHSRVTHYAHNSEVREGRTSWRVNVKLNEQPFRLARKMIRWQKPTKYEVGRWFESIERIEDGESVCIKVAAADELYLTKHHLVTHNTWLAMALAAYLFEDDKIDIAIVVSEKNKLTDWRDDFERATTLSVHRYHGTGRQNRLARAGIPHVLCTTYETGRNEFMTRAPRQPGKRGKGSMEDGPLVDVLGLHDKRILWIFDEVTKLKNRASELHQAYHYLLTKLRNGQCEQRVLGLTATPSERDFIDAYNVGRIVCPDFMPNVTTFEKVFTRGRDSFGHLVFRSDRKEHFADLFQEMVLRKRKSDPDVIEQFPKQIEKSIRVQMTPAQSKFYKAVNGILGEPDENELITQDEPRMFPILRMTAGHPASHVHKDNEISSEICATVGDKGLRDLGSAKTERLIELLKPIVKGQGAQVVVFTEFGGSVLLEVSRELKSAGFSVSEYHGGKSLHANDDAKDQFIRGNTEILLCSDAAARGLNLKNAEYVVNYELPVTFAKYQQRINRVHRIDSDKSICTAFSLVLEGTIEEAIMNLVMSRNRDHDILLGDEEDDTAFVSARQRREAFKG